MPPPNIDCPAPLGRTLLSSQRSLPGLRLRRRVILHQAAGQAGAHPIRTPAPDGQRPALTLVKHIEMAPKITREKLTPIKNGDGPRAPSARRSGQIAMTGAPHSGQTFRVQREFTTISWAAKTIIPRAGMQATRSSRTCRIYAKPPRSTAPSFAARVRLSVNAKAMMRGLT